MAISKIRAQLRIENSQENNNKICIDTFRSICLCQTKMDLIYVSRKYVAFSESRLFCSQSELCKSFFNRSDWLKKFQKGYFYFGHVNRVLVAFKLYSTPVQLDR